MENSSNVSHQISVYDAEEERVDDPRGPVHHLVNLVPSHREHLHSVEDIKNVMLQNITPTVNIIK